MDLKIVNGTVVTAAETRQSEVGIAGGRVVAISPRVEAAARETIDAAGCLVLPGCVEAHTHLDFPLAGTLSADDFENGTKVAALGGNTTLIDFATQFRGETLGQALENWFKKEGGKACIDFGFHMAFSEFTPGALAEVRKIVEAGLPSFKMYMAYRNVCMLDDGEIFQLMQAIRDAGGLVQVHAENGWVIDVLIKQHLAAGNRAPKYHALSRPAILEAEATHRAIVLADLAGVPLYVVHMSSAAAVDHVARARERGLPVYGETCNQYLVLTEEKYDSPGFEGAKYVLSPPLRAAGDRDALWRRLADGTVQTVATDHCPFRFEGQKSLGRDDFSKIPNGLPGLEAKLSIVHSEGVRRGRITVNKLVEVLAEGPARLFGLYPEKGTIAVGSDADIVIFDPAVAWKLDAEHLHSPLDYSPYEGMEVAGKARTVLLRGQDVVKDGRFVGRKGMGRFLKRRPGTAYR
jgi:dihydropyrimidinase